MWGTNKQRPIKTIFTRKIHSELLLSSGRIDLAILDESKIRFAMNSQGNGGYFAIEKGDHILIEIKSSQTNRSTISSKNRWKKMIFEDIKKLNKYSCHGYLLCFDYGEILDNSGVLDLEKKTKENVTLMYCISPIKHNYLKIKK